ncbi:hypothetical protein HK099_006581 [Clydaea vesicula]|uniref:Uncharacterized protein n=1 Tax=Clydaea vesicula TaxID=447962 RepID=A0AAD5U7R5_9FUNG|nr:hypothetical protein HK099_006581 [Clydaea vesicula]
MIFNQQTLATTTMAKKFSKDLNKEVSTKMHHNHAVPSTYNEKQTSFEKKDMITQTQQNDNPIKVFNVPIKFAQSLL